MVLKVSSKIDMETKGLFSTGEFAKLSRTTKDMLRNYEHLELLIPSRTHNNYRYYSCEQLGMINLIRTFKELGMSLDEIKNLKDKRTPESLYKICLEEITLINDRIQSLLDSQKLLLSIQNLIHNSMEADYNNIIFKTLPAEAIILGDLNDYSNGRNDYHALRDFYHHIHKDNPDLNMNYPVWAMFSGERIKQGDLKWPDRYYFYHPKGKSKRPEGLYAIGYMRGGYGGGGRLYERMLRHIDENDYDICGNAYEEYPLNELCISDDSDYLIRIMIEVRKKA